MRYTACPLSSCRRRAGADRACARARVAPPALAVRSRSRTAACRPTIIWADEAAELFARDETSGRGSALMQAVNLGIGRAAYEAALDYAQAPRAGRPADRRAPGDRDQACRNRHQNRSGARRSLAGGLGLRPSRRLCRPQPPRSAAPNHRTGVHLTGDARSRQGRGGSFWRHGRDARHADAEIRARRARLPAWRREQSRCQAADRRGSCRLPARAGAALAAE